MNYSLFSKELNLYLYLPPHSAHPPGVLKGMVYGVFLGALEDPGFTGLITALQILKNCLSHSGCTPYCPEATGLNRRLAPSRPALSADAECQMERYAARELREAPGGLKVTPEGVMDISGSLSQSTASRITSSMGRRLVGRM
jgi:hypothetical protein